MGDGRLDMVMDKLAALRYLSLPVTVIVLADASYSLVAQKQSSEGYPTDGVDFGRTDYAALRWAIGLPATSVDDAAGLQQQVREAFASAVSTVIEVSLPRNNYRGLI